MPIARPSYQELVNRIYNRVRAETGLTAGLESSIIGTIVKIMGAELDGIWSYVEELERQSNLSTATGSDLDNWGLLFGVPRRTAKQSSSVGYSRSLRITNNGSTPAVVPTGSRVYKDLDPQIAFFTTEGVTIAAGSAEDVHVTAADYGSIFNVAIGEINRHAVPNVSLTVTNILPLQSGAEQESDGSYRQRLQQELTRRDVLNRANVSSLMRSVPGVRDVYLLDMYRGAGTFDIIIIPYNFSVANTIIQECQSLLNSAVPAGVSAVARAPMYRQLDVQINITFSRTAGGSKDTIRQSIRDQISARIDNLPVEDGSGIGAFSTSQIEALATLADPSVVNVNVRLGLDGSPISNKGTITLGVGERLVLRALSVE
jgi:uncharacterized phage protein gp47/JayE